MQVSGENYAVMLKNNADLYGGVAFIWKVLDSNSCKVWYSNCTIIFNYIFPYAEARSFEASDCCLLYYIDASVAVTRNIKKIHFPS